MASIGIFLTNLPFKIKSKELLDELEACFGDAVREPRKKGQIKVKVFLPSAVTERSALNQKAVVAGLDTNYGALVEMAKGKKIKGRHICMKMDEGDPRNEEGDFLVKLTAEDRRARDRLCGITDRKATSIFKQILWNDVNRKVFPGSSSTINVKSDMASLNTAILDKPGRLLLCHSCPNPPSVRLEYATQIEALQCLVYLNQNPILSTPPSKFTDGYGQHVSNCSRKAGLGVDGSLLDINSLIQKCGFVPFTDIFDDILDYRRIEEMKSHCWRCKSEYNLIGVDAGLNFVAGICKCKYDEHLDVMSNVRGYFWPLENFTRLTFGQMTKAGESKELIIYHNPMRQKYESSEAYKKIVTPILQDDWKFMSQGYKELNKCIGSLNWFANIENLDNSTNVYCFGILIKKTTFWTPANLFKIKKLTVIFEVLFLKKEHVLIRKKGKVKKIVEGSKMSNIIVYVHVELDSKIIPILNKEIAVYPKPIKLEYNCIKKTINSWVKKEIVPLKLLMNPCQKWEIQKIEIKKKSWTTFHLKLKLMSSFLNEEQKNALKLAESSSISIIQGPPGTGKTFTAAVIATHFSVKEQGIILACAPSNFASDGLARSIAEESISFKVPRKVLRIFSKSQEEKMLKDSSTSKNKTGPLPYVLLHEAVRNSPQWMKTSGVARIVEKIKNGYEHLLTKFEAQTLNEHISEIEKEVMMDFDIFVSTVGSLSDKRVQSFGSLSTVILDEAGQLTQPAAIFPLTLNQSRTIIIGDHQQLRPQIASFAAESAGLEKSVMEWLEFGKQYAPWTILKEQHRMASNICQIVSAVSYKNDLRTAEELNNRPLDVPESIFDAIPEFQMSNFLVFDHRKAEIKIENSYKNNFEVQISLRLVKQLMLRGIPLSKVTILTLYDAQKEELRMQLHNKLGLSSNDITVVNVDGYQGRENSIVIVSFVRSNRLKAIGFASSQNRLNVAISRAKFFLILLCDLKTFEGHKNRAWTTFLTELKKTACIIKV